MQQKFPTSEFLLLSFYTKILRQSKTHHGSDGAGHETHCLYDPTQVKDNAFIHKKQMNKTFNEGSATLHKHEHEPRTVGDIIQDMLRSNSLFARAYHEHQAHFYPNTELGVDLKLITRQPRRMDIGEHKIGMITRDADDHYLFMENAVERKKATTVMHNPRMFKGECINVRLNADGTPYVTLRRPTYEGTEGFTWFCRKAAQELLTMADAFER